MKNLFLLALARFQAADQKDKLSYYQLSGMCAPCHAKPTFIAP